MLIVIKPFCNEFNRENRMDEILSEVLAGRKAEFILTADEMGKNDLQNQRIIFAVCLSDAGVNLEYYRILDYLRKNPQCLKGAVAGIIVDGSGELFTKSLARRLAFSANMAGCTFPGKPLVEATGSLNNFNIVAKVQGCNNLEAYRSMVSLLFDKVESFNHGVLPAKKENILVIHASSRKTSNSLLLWEMVKKEIDQKADIKEIPLRNGDIPDCRGCKYEDCLHFGEKGECFYGGIMVDEVYPTIIKCDTLVMVCPNYNDAISANITAFVNRLTAVFRTNDFSGKRVFAIVVSGYSGSDIVAEQIIGAMNFNKNFILPGNFAIVETANDPKSILKVEGIQLKAKEMALRILGK